MTQETQERATVQARPHRMKGRRARRGTDLFSAMLYLGLFVLVIVMAIALYSSVMNGIRNTNTRMLILRTVTTVDNAFRNQANYASGSLVPVLKTSGNFSEKEVWRTGTTYFMMSPFDTPITVVGDGARNVTITTADLSDSACAALVESMIDPGRRVDGVSVNGTALVLPYDSQAVSTACDGAADDLYDVAIIF